ncbi:MULTISPECIES: MaoC family dehydratase N-terminal domain-containing protein [Polymorphospora]|uniref:MaoC family dehydratase N-terminal domain-containing protein n=1 Tax=Polymorphospora lycopeni TaxID=3140240 RepID=A0ABV5CXI8_9ACTN
MTDPTTRPLGTLTLPVDRIKVRELARALRADPGTVPPTFTVVAAHHTPAGGSPNELIIAAAGLDQPRVLLGELSWTYRRPLRTGETLTGTVRLDDRTVRRGRRGGEMVLATGTTIWCDEAGAEVQRGRVVLIQPEAPATGGSSTVTRAAADGPPAPADPAAADPDTLRLSRTDIVRYAGAAGDFNPVHHDEGHAVRLGFPGVFAMGLLPGGILAAEAARVLRPRPLSAVAIRFTGQTWPDVTYRRHRDPLPATDDRGGGIELGLTGPAGEQTVRVRAYPGPQGGA